MDTNRIKKSFVRSIVPGQGGLACVVSIINYHGGCVSFYDLLAKNGRMKGTIRMLKLLGLAQCEGFDANGYKGDIDYLKELESPAVLHIQRDTGEEDFVVLYGWENNKFVIGDPGWGILEYRDDELNEAWKSKALMTMEPGESFLTVKEKLRKKKETGLSIIKKSETCANISRCL